MQQRYQELGLQLALSRKCDYAQACKELATVVKRAYALAPKTLQAIIYHDILAAFRLVPELETSQQISAANILLQAAESVLPRQRKSVVVGLFKHSSVLQRRRCKGKEGENGSFQASMDILVHIFGFLDVRSLASAANVCRSWHVAARDETLWYAQFLFHFGNINLSPRQHTRKTEDDNSATLGNGLWRMPTAEPVRWRKLFEYYRRGHSLRLFMSNRAYCSTCKCVLWLKEGMNETTPVCSLSQNQHHKLKPMVPAQILRYVVKDSSISSSSSDSGSDSEEDVPETAYLRFSRLWAVPKLTNDIDTVGCNGEACKP